MQLCVEATKARAVLGWAPGSMKDALRETIADALRARGKSLPA